MKNQNEITVTITVPIENGIVHTHSAHLPYDDEHDVMATDFLCEVIDLMKCVFGETDTENSIKQIIEKYKTHIV